VKILIVEDDDSKREALTSFLATLFRDPEFVAAQSYQSALREVRREDLSLVVLDVALPTVDVSTIDDGGRPQPFGGRDVLAKMRARNSSVATVVVTQFDRFADGPSALTIEQLMAQFRKHYSPPYIGAVLYDGSSSKWKSDLRGLLEASGLLGGAV
jgi:CheY-like chemotaxis protein